MGWLVTGILFWFAETAYFGFNWSPSCRAEMWCDHIARGWILYGLILVIVRREISRKKG